MATGMVDSAVDTEAWAEDTEWARPSGAPSADQGLPGDSILGRVPLGALLIATLGLVLVLTALLGMRWPVDPNAPTAVGPHISRLTTAPDGETFPAAIARIVLNAGIYIIFLVSLLTVILGAFRSSPATGRMLCLMALLGLMYVAGMALYTSGAVATFGFMLQLFGGFMIWVASDAPDLDARPLNIPSPAAGAGPTAS